VPPSQGGNHDTWMLRKNPVYKKELAFQIIGGKNVAKLPMNSFSSRQTT